MDLLVSIFDKSKEMFLNNWLMLLILFALFISVYEPIMFLRRSRVSESDMASVGMSKIVKSFDKQAIMNKRRLINTLKLMLKDIDNNNHDFVNEQLNIAPPQFIRVFFKFAEEKELLLRMPKPDNPKAFEEDSRYNKKHINYLIKEAKRNKFNYYFQE